MKGLNTILLRDGRNIGGVIPDVVIDEQHEDTLTITDHPVEQGAPVTDHAYKNPAELSMRIGWSASSLALGGAISGIQSGTLLQGRLSTVRDVYESLLKLQQSRKPFAVSTGKRLYQNMLIKSLSVRTDAATENALICTVVLREVRLVSAPPGRSPASSQRNPGRTAPITERGTVNPLPVPTPKAVEEALSRARLND